ncbi:zinc-finger domain-containing protein [Wenzhouxiangella sp. AB-CW3]|uniref:zinc-finger domain-containing protein n=1 Tax=Wenzhouxiangella sp. AB-CW3 TaxID=2771012 RepID=UPI00168B9501|nr:zinc-finger domain-containing protein [Wenzhouxiangella sp. AB-CW3]QOC22484.1 zinc-finger domain-containing protein [Wenzhouxiangella sp. AB-CW3]
MVAKRKQEAQEAACSEAVLEVCWEDLPLSCPTAEMKLWNAHPRVYLPIHRSGEARCSYCGTRYVLKDPEPDQAMPRFDNQEIEDRFRRAQQRVRDMRV